MTIKPHLFYSSLIHTLLLAYLISIPIYKGSLYSMSFGPYSVDLVSEGKPATKSSVAYKAPQPKAQPYVRQQTSSTKAEAPHRVEVAETEEPALENTNQNETEPPGITLMPEEPKKEPLIAKVEVPVVEHKQEAEKKPEPPKTEPVVQIPPPETKPAPEPIKQEMPQPKEPQAVQTAETKPSQADTIETPVESEFPVKADEKATEVSPLTKKAGEIREKQNDQAKALAGEKISKEAPAPGPTKKSNGQKGRSKGAKKAGQKIAAPATGESSAQNSEIASPSARNDITNSSAGNQGDSPNPDDGKTQMAGITLPEAEKAKEPAEKKPSLGIAVSDALFYRDIKVEVFLKKSDSVNISSILYKKPHPSDDGYSRPDQKAIDLVEESETGGKIIFSVAKAEKGIYTFVMKNTGETLQKTSLMIRLLEGKKGARNRKFETINLKPHTELTVKFILPEGIFWDDESYFTGSIESSETITKFNDTTGVVWKEQKDE
jgi:hypothetical protein